MGTAPSKVLLPGALLHVVEQKGCVTNRGSCDFFFLLESYLAMTRYFSWLCTQELLLVVLRGQYGILEIEPDSAACKAGVLSVVLSSTSLFIFFCNMVDGNSYANRKEPIHLGRGEESQQYWREERITAEWWLRSRGAKAVSDTLSMVLGKMDLGRN